MHWFPNRSPRDAKKTYTIQDNKKYKASCKYLKSKNFYFINLKLSLFKKNQKNKKYGFKTELQRLKKFRDLEE